MTNMEIIWAHFLLKHPTTIFIHDSICFQDFPQFLSLVDSSSSQFCQILHQLLGFLPKYPNVYRKLIKDNLNP